MLKTEPWIRIAEGLECEILQAFDEGKFINDLREQARNVAGISIDNPQREILAAEVYSKIQSRSYREDYYFIEPSEYDEIIQCSNSCNIQYINTSLSYEESYDKIYGAWTARCCGCLLGQPIEGWYRERIIGLLKETNNYPVKRYISSNIDVLIREKYSIVDKDGAYGNNLKSWINNVSCMPEDDDTNYTILGLKILENFGKGFTSEDVALSWLKNLPYLHLCTAERIAYKNLANMILPPMSAITNNPFREFIGAQIRCDMYGYINPGNPVLAAKMAFADASISHVKNGIYGAMFLAAMIAVAAVNDNIKEIINIALDCIPIKSRLFREINRVLKTKNKFEAIALVHADYKETDFYHWCHTIPNAMIICAALLHGEKNMDETMSIAIESAFDTDCNAASAGSVLGMVNGYRKIPESWKKPLNDCVISCVDGIKKVKISNLAERTVRLI